MVQILLIQQVKDMARRSVERGAGRNSHHFPAGSDHARVFEAEYDRLDADHAILAYLKPTMVRQRPVSEGAKA